MASDRGVLLGVVGVYWIGTMLVLILGSTAVAAAREFLSTLNLYTHLGLWFAVLVPGVVMVVLSERMRGGAGGSP